MDLYLERIEKLLADVKRLEYEAAWARYDRDEWKKLAESWGEKYRVMNEAVNRYREAFWDLYRLKTPTDPNYDTVRRKDAEARIALFTALDEARGEQ